MSRNLDLFDAMEAEFAKLPVGTPDEGTMRLRLGFDDMERLVSMIDGLRLPGESIGQTVYRVVRHVAERTADDRADTEA
jgi:hypothetical protein